MSCNFNQFLNHEHFQTKYNLTTPFLQYSGLISCLKQLRQAIEPNKKKKKKRADKDLVHNAFSGPGATKKIYKLFVKN